MGRRRDDGPWMTIFDLFTRLPWPLGVGIGVLVFLAMRFLLPLQFSDDPADKIWKTFLCTGPLPYLVAAAFVAGGIASAVRSARRRRLYQGQQSLGDIRSLSWREFEAYVGEAYRRQGYEIEETGGGGADGGVDLILRRDGETVLVQCKHWRHERVTINVVREMYGLLCAKSASRVVIATTGDFTPDARAFAGDKPIELLNGHRLEHRDKIPGAISVFRHHPISHLCALCVLCGEKLLGTSESAIDRGSSNGAENPAGSLARPATGDTPVPTGNSEPCFSRNGAKSAKKFRCDFLCDLGVLGERKCM